MALVVRNKRTGQIDVTVDMTPDTVIHQTTNPITYGDFIKLVYDGDVSLDLYLWAWSGERGLGSYPTDYYDILAPATKLAKLLYGQD